MENSLIYDSKKYSSRNIVELNSQGVKVLCPICQTELIVITSKDLVAKYKKPQGIFCPNSDRHVWTKFILIEEREQFWEKVKKRAEEIEAEKNKNN
jgi:uncharacterized Zn finger protein (UPF0148 family)